MKHNIINMKLCRCTEPSYWFTVVDSTPTDDGEYVLDGGPWNYEVDGVYEYHTEEDGFGLKYIIKHNSGKTCGFPEDKFLEHFLVVV